MLKTHNQYFKELISARTEEIMRQVLFNNKRCLELAGEISEAQLALTEPHRRIKAPASIRRGT
jgi:hypothetical protein